MVSVSYDVLCVVFIFCRFTLALCMFIFIFTSAEHWWLRVARGARASSRVAPRLLLGCFWAACGSLLGRRGVAGSLAGRCLEAARAGRALFWLLFY